MKEYQLKSLYDARKSFYGKAVVTEDEKTSTLYSYNRKTATFESGGKFRIYNIQSMTTSRHIKEFYKQNTGGKEITRKEMDKILERED